jgi:hypothetical protein
MLAVLQIPARLRGTDIVVIEAKQGHDERDFHKVVIPAEAVIHFAFGSRR